jgi:hypothetical protein
MKRATFDLGLNAILNAFGHIWVEIGLYFNTCFFGYTVQTCAQLNIAKLAQK